MRKKTGPLFLAVLLLLASFVQAATVTWRGNAPAVAQVNTWVFTGTWETNDIIKVVINGKTVQITTGSATIATFFATLVAALNASTIPEFAEITWGGTSPNLTGTCDTPGVPFTATMQPFESDGTTPDADALIAGVNTATSGTATTASSGPNDWSTAANWSGGAVPVNSDDVVFIDSNVDCLYGLAQSGVTLASTSIEQSYTGKLGLPRTRGSGSSSYAEYRADFLAISSTTITIGAGSGNGSGRIKINTGTNQTAVIVFNTGQSVESGIKAFLWKGAHNSNTVEVNKGSVGVATIPGEAATIATLRVAHQGNPAGDVDMYLGAGCTLTTITKSGGTLVVNSNVTTLTQGPGNAGTTNLVAGTVGTLALSGGKVIYRSSGTLTAGTVTGPGELDCSQDNTGRTFTNLTLNPGATFKDPAKTVTHTNPFVIVGPLSGVTLDLGSNFSLQRS